jgi:catechol 2,3-dioxygenase-like lactoylglutathione lyase family enzyme
MSAAPANLGIKNIGQISIVVHDLPRATEFYRDTLGLPLLFTAGNMAFFDCGGVRLMLGPAETPELAIRAPSSISALRISPPPISDS